MSETTDQLWALTGLLRAAVGTLEELAANNPLLERLLHVFLLLPPGDREPILGLLEREVAYRIEHDGSAGHADDPDGVRVNPGATLYFRVYEGTAPIDIGHDEVAAAIIRATKVIQMVLGMAPETRELLAGTIRRTFLSLPREEREAAGFCVDAVMAARRVAES